MTSPGRILPSEDGVETSLLGIEYPGRPRHALGFHTGDLGDAAFLSQVATEDAR